MAIGEDKKFQLAQYSGSGLHKPIGPDSKKLTKLISELNQLGDFEGLSNDDLALKWTISLENQSSYALHLMFNIEYSFVGITAFMKLESTNDDANELPTELEELLNAAEFRADPYHTECWKT